MSLSVYKRRWFGLPSDSTHSKAADLQILKNKKIKNNKINGKYWSSYVQWRNLLLLTPYSVDKIIGKTAFFFA